MWIQYTTNQNGSFKLQDARQNIVLYFPFLEIILPLTFY